jgi:arylsulfatase A-like enzyme
MSTLPTVRSLIGNTGATFSNAVAPFPLCCPARATLLTGQYAHNHGVLGNGDEFNPLGGFANFKDAHTLATWLTPDYTTGWLGKYLNGYSGRYIPPGWDVWKAPGTNWSSYKPTTYNVNGTIVNYSQYQTDLVAGFATSFINQYAPQQQPFFLVTSLLAPHTGSPVEADDPKKVYGTKANAYLTPNVAPAYHDRFASLPLDADPSFNEADVSDKPVKPALLPDWAVASLREVNAQRRESLLSAQDAVTNIINALQANGELSNTYVIFLSDNGYMLGEHRLGNNKAAPYEPSVLVPLLIRGPGIPAGRVVHQPVGQQDLARTILAMTNHVGANGTFVMDGMNVLPMITDPTLNANRPIVIEAGPTTTTSSTYKFHGIRMPGWKYVERASGAKELYDLTADPYELDNVAGKPAYATKQQQMRALLQQYEWCAGAACP